MLSLTGRLKGNVESDLSLTCEAHMFRNYSVFTLYVSLPPFSFFAFMIIIL